MSLRNVSLSTCGLADKIDELAKLKLGLTLSVSLHAVTDDERSAIMPVNRMWNIAELLKSCRNYFKVTGRRISFEYALIDGVNDTQEHAIGLYCLFRDAKMPPHSFHVNLIPVNEVRKLGFKQSRDAKGFCKVLEQFRIHATVRRTMGADISAACGQLRNREQVTSNREQVIGNNGQRIQISKS
jgi:23S rRNA (adenine2503-C2)-methyltransferase